MVNEQLAGRGIADGDVLAAMRSVPRHLFVPEGMADRAYVDAPLSIGYGQTISQPYMVALMTEELRVTVRSRVLEVGTGSGYQTAVLAELAGEVFALERLAPLAERARAVLARLQYDNVRVAVGDGTQGWPEEAPFDRILVAAAIEKPPPLLLEQLADRGRLVIPIGDSKREQTLMVFERDGEQLIRRASVACRFVPLMSAEERQDEQDGPVTREWGLFGESGSTQGGEAATMKAVRVGVHGRVQGVYYRARAQAEGERLGLRGWVKNVSDGSVALHLQGDPAAVEAMLGWCSVGPPAAHVRRVEVNDAEPDETLSRFEVR